MIPLPIPSPDGDVFVESIVQAERLLEYCPAEFVAKHFPMVERCDDGDEVDYFFPSGFGVSKARKLIAELWPSMPEASRRLFLADQFSTALGHIAAAELAFKGAGLDFRVLDKSELREAFHSILKVLRRYRQEHKLTHFPELEDEE